MNKKNEQIYFVKRLSFLIKAGIAMVDALHILREQTVSKRQTQVLDSIIHDVKNGKSLAKSFAKFPKVFSEFTVHIVKVGESSGTLSQNLEYLAEELEKNQQLRRKIIGALIYPALITIATLAITAFLMLYLFPKIMPIFTALHAELPLPTKIVIALSSFLERWGIPIMILVAFSALVFNLALKKSGRFHFFFDRTILRIKMIGTMVQYYNVANISRTLGLLLKSGIRLSEALPITADATKNCVYKKECEQLSKVVARGERISTYLKSRRSIFPDIFSHMIEVGERSGTLSETLVYLSDMYEREVDDFTKNLSALIEPALMIFMGLLVGFIAISIITPIYGITQNLHG